jgi:hypothetical protein
LESELYEALDDLLRIVKLDAISAIEHGKE